MDEYIKLFETHSEYETYIQGDSKVFPNVSLCEDQKELHYNKKPDYSQDYLTFIIKTSGTFEIYPFDADNVYYSLDNGKTWEDFSQGGEIEVFAGDKLMWKGTSSGTRYWDKGQGSTVHFDIQGNIMSLLYDDDFEGQIDLTDKGFSNLFSEWYVESAKNLILPATTLVDDCYYGMFQNCTSLITAPKLPATTLAGNCYGNMFDGCINLTTAPILPAETLANYCYQYMFQGCTSLTTVSKLPATILVTGCYYSMFSGCTSLVNAPELPAITLASNCYEYMFDDCTSLNYIKAMFTTTPSASSPNYYTSHWVSGVAANGTFIKNAAAQWDVSGIHGIPTGWTVQTANE